MLIRRIVCSCNNIISSSASLNFSTLRNVLSKNSAFRFSLSRHYSVENKLRMKYMRFEDKLLLTDKLPRNYELIYKAPMQMYIAVASVLVTTSAVLCTITGIYKFLIKKDMYTDPIMAGMSTVIATSGNEFVAFSAMFIVLSTAVAVITSRYVLRIYRCQDRYIAVFRGVVPLTTKKVHFVKGQVELQPPRGIMPWQDARHKLADRKNVLILDEYFRTPYDYNEMLGLSRVK